MRTSHLVKFRWSSWDIRNLHTRFIIIIIKSDVSTFPIGAIFGRGCVSEVTVFASYRSLEIRVFVFITTVQFMSRVNDWVHYDMQMVLVCFSRCPIPSLCLRRLIGKHWTYKTFSIHVLSRVCLNLFQFSFHFPPSFGIWYMGLCVSCLHLFYDDCGNICTSIHNGHKIRSKSQ